MTKAVYNILENNKDYILLQDVGEKHDRSLTNDMESVIQELFEKKIIKAWC